MLQYVALVESARSSIWLKTFCAQILCCARRSCCMQLLPIDTWMHWERSSLFLSFRFVQFWSQSTRGFVKIFKFLSMFLLPSQIDINVFFNRQQIYWGKLDKWYIKLKESGEEFNQKLNEKKKKTLLIRQSPKNTDGPSPKYLKNLVHSMGQAQPKNSKLEP